MASMRMLTRCVLQNFVSSHVALFHAFGRCMFEASRCSLSNHMNA